MTGNHFRMPNVQLKRSMVRTLIADCEPLARQHLYRLLSAHGYAPALCSDSKHFSSTLDRLRPQLIFLDLDLVPVELGMRCVSAIEPEPAIVVTSAHPDVSAPRELEPVDYLLKPFDGERFDKVLARAEAFLGAGPSDPLRRQHLRLLNAYPEAPKDRFSHTGHYLDRVLVRDGERIFFLKAEDIDRIEADGEMVEIHTPNQVYRIRENIDAVARRLDPRQFLSIRRTMIVNLDRLPAPNAVQGAN